VSDTETRCQRRGIKESVSTSHYSRSLLTAGGTVGSMCNFRRSKMAKVHYSTQDPKIKYKACIKQMYKAGHRGIILKIILRHVCHEGSRFRTRGMRILFYFTISVERSLGCRTAEYNQSNRYLVYLEKNESMILVCHRLYVSTRPKVSIFCFIYKLVLTFRLRRTVT
jgi:hypothetical protein